MLLLLSLMLSCSAESLSYTRNSVIYAGSSLKPTNSILTTEPSSQDVLKELGVDLSNEGKKTCFFIFLLKNVGTPGEKSQKVR